MQRGTQPTYALSLFNLSIALPRYAALDVLLVELRLLETLPPTCVLEIVFRDRYGAKAARYVQA